MFTLDAWIMILRLLFLSSFQIFSILLHKIIFFVSQTSSRLFLSIFLYSNHMCQTTLNSFLYFLLFVRVFTTALVVLAFSFLVKHLRRDIKKCVLSACMPCISIVTHNRFLWVIKTA